MKKIKYSCVILLLAVCTLSKAQNLQIDSLEQLLRVSGNDSVRCSLLGLLAEGYEKRKDGRALEFYRRHVFLRDSITNDKNRKVILKKQLQFEYNKKATADSLVRVNETAMKNAELSEQRSKIEVKNIQLYLLFGGVAMAVLFTFFIFRRFRHTQNQKKIIESQKEEMEFQKKLIEEKQTEIIDSILYARKIQSAHLPTEKYVEKTFRKLNTGIERT